ncbi:MAG: hypothetical protein H6898_00435 [Rhodobacter sp.]|nr:hypothetical protein [Paracoccaceae bacterium]MCC0075037.1 hypothetical protein [Rhodobacter sp.]
MSDAMTNREIEDVLTSIRRLVAQEGGRGPETGRLILTEAQRIIAEPEPEPEAEPASEALSADGAETAADPATGDTSRGDLELPAPDFVQLEATIAELEAAVSACGGSWEPESSTEEAPRASNVTELYGRLSFQHRRREAQAGEDAGEIDAETAIEEALDEPQGGVSEALDETVIEGMDPGEAMTPAEPAVDPSAVAALAAAAPPDTPGAASPDEAEIEGEIEGVIDEAMLRALVSQIVREELHGQLGERITLQVRKLVRAEIAKVLDERKFL